MSNKIEELLKEISNKLGFIIECKCIGSEIIEEDEVLYSQQISGTDNYNKWLENK